MFSLNYPGSLDFRIPNSRKEWLVAQGKNRGGNPLTSKKTTALISFTILLVAPGSTRLMSLVTHFILGAPEILQMPFWVLVVVFSLRNRVSLDMFWVSTYSSPILRPESSSREQKKQNGEKCIFVILGMCQSNVGKRNLVNF